MTNHVLALGSALYSRLNSQGTVDVYYNLAPQNTPPPYAVIQPQSLGVDSYVFGDTDSNTISCLYTIKIIDDNRFPFNAWSIYQHLDTALQNYNLSITGYDLLRVNRDSSIELRDEQKFWNCGSLFRIDLHKQ